ncbi:MAG TPA: hypothetical protein VNM67_17785 [Thermoanaerobaculia bacterium]|jgi:hypothetical protein|nr:hypothetical protein [Thermoanaerobaculia bacterium]
MLLLTIAALLIGHGITGYWRGILIDERNKMSLARLQLAMWTVIIVSAVLVLFFWRLFAKVEGPLDITIPEQIWALLGISTTSLVGSSLIKTNKKNQSPNLEEEQETGRRVSDQGVDPSDLRVTGRVVLNESASMASWADLFRGEESGNATAVSLGKFQMFYFTLIAVVSYGYALAEMFGANTPAAGFPAVSSGLLTLLGISHGGYLAEKAVPHTQEPASQPLPTPAQGAMVAAAPAPITVVRQIRRAARPLGQP